MIDIAFSALEGPREQPGDVPFPAANLFDIAIFRNVARIKFLSVFGRSNHFSSVDCPGASTGTTSRIRFRDR